MSDWKSYLRARLGARGLDGATEADSIEELAQHLGDREAEALAAGMSAEAAREAALAELPDLAPLCDEIRLRAMSRSVLPPPVPVRSRPLSGILQDVAYSLRLLRRNPGFAIVAVLTLALGIGANTAVFTLVNGVLLKPLPYPDSQRLVALYHFTHGERDVMSPPNFLDLRAQSRTLADAAACTDQGYTLTGFGAPVRLRGMQITDRFFETLGVHPLMGRPPRREENQPGHAHVVVLGYAVWQARFNADPHLVGKTIFLDRTPFTVVGVMPAGFSWPGTTEIWTPFEYDAAFTQTNRGGWYLSAIGRLKPSASVADLAAEAAAIARRLEPMYPNSNTHLSFTAASLQDMLVGDTRTSLLVLLGAVGLVLLIACANMANLLLARASKRAHEVAVRAALGAGRSRLGRQLMTESAVLAALGALAGLAVGYGLMRAFIALAPAGTPRLREVALDARVLGFTLFVTALTTLLFAVVPARRLASLDLAHALKEGGRSLNRAGATRLRSVLVVAETALAVALLVGAGLLAASFARLQHVDPGFTSAGALTFRVSLPDSAYADDPAKAAFFDRLLPALRALPGVRDTGAVMLLPLSGDFFSFTFDIEGHPPFPRGEGPSLATQVATSSYFRAVGIPLVRGRFFTERDDASAARVLLISEAAARRFFPREEPIGKRLSLGWKNHGQRVAGEIVGIVGDVREISLRDRQPPEVYIPHAQLPLGSMAVIMRTSLPPTSVARAAERVVHRIDADLPITQVRSLDQHVAASIAAPRFYTALVAAFAGLALSLAAIGVFGVLSFVVGQRTREIGIRIALGCAPSRVMRDVIARAMLLAATGLVAGLLLAIPLSRVLRGLLFETATTDPLILASTVAVLSLVALAASYLPARRATRVDPLVALRSE